MKPDSGRLAARVAALGEAVTAAEGRSDATVVANAKAVVERAGERVAFSGSHTVIALAGATGSGKSSLFNALTGSQLAQVAVRRPTTARPMAAGWGSELPHDLLDWLDISQRHLLAAPASALSDLVLLDLPDHDSTELGHRLTVNRLVELVDALIWVVDPQKYADAALHDGYLKPLSGYAGVMLVVLNQSDRLEPAELDRCVRDLRRILDAEGLRATPIMTTSALTGTGVAELRESLARTVAAKQATTKRLAADVRVAATALAKDLGGASTTGIEAGLRRQVERVLADAAGVPVVVDGVRKAWRKRGAAATGWPFVSWIARLKPDPLKRLRLDLAPNEHSPVQVNRTSLPQASAVQRARVEQGLRELVEATTAGLPRGWAQAVRQAASRDQALLTAELDRAIAGADLGVRKGTWWWGLIGVLQWLLIAAVLGGLGWLFINPVLTGLGLPTVLVPVWQGLPVPTWLLLGGLVGGVLLAVLGRALVEIGAAGHARAAQRRLTQAVADVAGRELFDPVAAELERYATARKALKLASA